MSAKASVGYFSDPAEDTPFCASNSIGQDAMSAVGLFAPIGFVIGAVSMMLLGGSQILSAEYKRKTVPHIRQDFAPP